MTTKLKLLTDWGKLNGLLKEDRSAEPSLSIDLKKLEQKIFLKFPEQHQELKTFFESLQTSWPNITSRALHLYCDLKNSHYQQEFIAITQEELKAHTHEAYLIHCDKLKPDGSVLPFLEEIKNAVSVNLAPLRAVYLSNVEKLGVKQWEEIQSYFSKTTPAAKHLCFYTACQTVSPNEPARPVKHFRFDAELQFKDFTNESLAQAIVQHICELAKSHKLNIHYIEPEVVLGIFKELRKIQKGGMLPLKETVGHFCLEAFVNAAQITDAPIHLSMSWLGDLIIQKAAA